MGLHAVHEWYQPAHDTIWWNVKLLYIESVLIANYSHFSTDIFFAFVVYLSTGEWVLAPIPEHWPGRREAEPFHQRQLRPRLQCLPELLCCDRYNLTHARLIPKRIKHSCSRSKTSAARWLNFSAENAYIVYLALLLLLRLSISRHGISPTVLQMCFS